MAGWLILRSTVISVLCSGNRSTSSRGLLTVCLLCLFPSLCFCRSDLYFQINTGTVVLFEKEISRYWNAGPSLSGEIGCCLGGLLTPSIGFSYTLLTPDWDELERQTTRALQPTGRRSQLLAGTFSLKLTDFEENSILRSYISLSTTFATQRTDRVVFRGGHFPMETLCQSGTASRTSVSRGMVLLGLGAGFGVGMEKSCTTLIQTRLLFTLNRGFVYLPVEIGLRF
jgi:hypothetical protein